MNRRAFLRSGLQAGSALGLTLMAPRGRGLHAAPSMYGGPYFVFVNASGGWDPTVFCDPKGGKDDDRTSVNQSYTPQQIGKVGAFDYAPVGYTVGATEVYSPKRFFEAHGSQFLVLNGVDTTTNNHDAGSRCTWSGKTAESHPTFAALAAGIKNEGLSVPMPFVSYGGYDNTFGTVALTRAGNVDSIQRLAYTNRRWTDQVDSRFVSDATNARIREAQAARLETMKNASLPRTRRSVGELFLARSSDSGLQVLADRLKELKSVEVSDLPGLAPVANQLGGLRDLLEQAQFAVASFQVGAAVSVNLNLGGFDTHSNHDESQTRQMMTLLRGVDYLMIELGKAGLLDKTYVVVGSDFGRTPYYNDGNGKDHWNVTSMLVAGPGVAGGRVVGATDKGQKALAVDASSLAPVEDKSAGVVIQPHHVHRALRKAAGIEEHPLAKQYPLAAEDLPLFG